jgi:hypothetical protein
VISWTHQEGDLYVVTGVLTNGKRFALTTHSWPHASGINLYRGSKWLYRGGKRRLIIRVYN